MAKADSDDVSLDRDPRALRRLAKSAASLSSNSDSCVARRDKEALTAISAMICAPVLDSNKPGRPPPGVSSSLYAFVRKLRDAAGSENLWPFATRLAASSPLGGTDREAAASRTAELARVFRLADWATREVAPLALDLVALNMQSRLLRSLAPVQDSNSARAGADTANTAAVRASVASAGASNSADFARKAAVFAGRADDAFNVPDPVALAWAGAYAAGSAAAAAESAAAAGVDRQVLIAMQLSLLNELCPDLDSGGLRF